MKSRRTCLLLAALCLSLVATQYGNAQDAGISSQIAKIKRSLHDDGNGLDLKALKAAASSLTRIWPKALEALSPEGGTKEYEVDSARGDEPYVPRLALNEHQRMALLNAYQDYAENIATIAGRRPFDQQAADQMKGAVAALQQFLGKLKGLLDMDNNSAEYRKAVDSLVNEEKHANK
jgi:hypothetical protein